MGYNFYKCEYLLVLLTVICYSALNVFLFFYFCLDKPRPLKWKIVYFSLFYDIFKPDS